MSKKNDKDPLVTRGWYSGRDSKTFPFETFRELDWSFDSYTFTITSVFRKKKTGELYVAFDEGCSCPVPFEGLRESELTPLKKIKHLDEFCAPHLMDLSKSVGSDGWHNLTPGQYSSKLEQWVRFREAVANELSNQKSTTTKKEESK